ncbi:MAG: hypothetical protein FWD13_04660 [Treponema sp.]|nr:hypothetical protein [Treponema sp.]
MQGKNREIVKYLYLTYGKEIKIIFFIFGQAKWLVRAIYRYIFYGDMPMKKNMESNDNLPVKYEGEFVLTRNGGKDFGEIPIEIANIIKRQAGKIRLRIGKQEKDKDNYGEKHIERPDRLHQLQKNGYEKARDLVQDVANGYNAIYGGKNGRLTLYKKINKKGIALFIMLMASSDDNFYDVKTGMITRDTYYKNKKPLWEKTQSG